MKLNRGNCTNLEKKGAGDGRKAELSIASSPGRWKRF
jgi:hypothetical protein